MGKSTRRRPIEIPMPLRFGLLGGITGVLVDIDHPIALLLHKANERFLHPYFAFIAGGIILGSGAYIGGLYIKHLLEAKKEV